MTKKIRRNKTLAIIQQSMRTVSVLCASGTLMQAFLAYIGFAESNIYWHATLVNAVNVATILLFSHFADGKRPLLRSALVQIPHGIFFLCFLPFCFGIEASTEAFLILLAVSLAQAVCHALNSICEYKLPYHLYRAQDYGPIQAISGLIAAFLSFLVGVIFDYLKTTIPFGRLMMYAFVVAALFMILAGVSMRFQTILTRTEREGGSSDEEKQKEETEKKTETPTQKKISILALFRTPVFYLLIPANLLRGIAAGCVTVLATVAISLGFRDVAPIMVSVASVANLVACFVFGISCRYYSPRLAILVGSLCFLLLPLGLCSSPTLFLVMYAVVYFGKIVVDVAVPSLLVCAVDAEIAGPYNAWRLILHMGGMTLATSVAALPFVTPTMLLWATLACSVISGVSFFAIPLLVKASPLCPNGKPHLLRLHEKK